MMGTLHSLLQSPGLAAGNYRTFRTSGGVRVHIQDVAYHRNGVAGIGFYVIRFAASYGEGRKPFVATVFPESGAVSVLRTDLLAEGIIGFGENSWRGDDFERGLRAYIAALEVA